jgi:hypothetical protein
MTQAAISAENAEIDINKPEPYAAGMLNIGSANTDDTRRFYLRFFVNGKTCPAKTAALWSEPGFPWRK